MLSNPSWQPMGGEEAGKTRLWVNCGQVANSIFVEPESWLDFAQQFQVNALLETVVSQHLDHFCQANRWSRQSPSGTAPEERSRHTSVWSDVADGMYVFGGWGSGGLRVNGLRAEHAAALHCLAEVTISMTSTFSTARRREGGIWLSWKRSMRSDDLT